MQNYQTLQGYVADLPTSRSSIWISSPLHFMLLVHQLLCPTELTSMPQISWQQLNSQMTSIKESTLGFTSQLQMWEGDVLLEDNHVQELVGFFHAWIMILRFASRSEGKEGCEGGKRKFIPAAIRSLSSLHNDCGTPVPWRMMPHETKHPFKNLFTKGRNKKIPKIIKNQLINPLVTRTIRKEQQQHQRGQHN